MGKINILIQGDVSEKAFDILKDFKDNKAPLKVVLLKKVGMVDEKGLGFGDTKAVHFGLFVKEPTVGERFELLPLGCSGISTSAVQKIVDGSTFETYNSIYRYKTCEI